MNFIPKADQVMLKVILTVGIVASGKSTWAKEEVKKDPTGTVRVNRDDLRIMMSNYVYSQQNERLVVSTRNHIITSALKSGKNVIIDDTNLNRRNFDDVCKLVKNLGISCMVMEKPFYVDLDEAIARNAKREGYALIPEEVIHKMWEQTGGEKHKFYNGRVEVFGDYNQTMNDSNVTNNNPELNWAVVCDLDGTISLFNPMLKNGSFDNRYPGAHIRNPYDASSADNDTPNEAVVITLEALARAGYHVIFCSGREDKYRPQTETFLNKNVTFKYDLIMRKTGDNRKDSIIKEELYNEYIAGKYNVLMVLDDRKQVVDFWRSKGLKCWQVAPGNF